MTRARQVGADGRLPVFWGPQDDGLWPKVTVRGHLELVAGDIRRESVSELLARCDEMQRLWSGELEVEAQEPALQES